MKLINSVISIIYLVYFYGCSVHNYSTKLPELVEFRNIESGTTDSVSVDEIIYAVKHDIQLFKNENVKATYDTTNRLFILKPEKDFSGLTFVKFNLNGDEKYLPLIVREKTEVLFSFKPKLKPNKMYVMGNFNDWSRNSDEMLDEDGDGVYTKIVPLNDGVYEYQFVIDQSEIFDPNNSEKVDNGFGYFNSIKRVKSIHSQSKPGIYFLPKQKGEWLELAIDSNDLSGISVNVLLDNSMYSQNYIKTDNEITKIDLKPLQTLQGMHVLRIVASRNNQPGNVLTSWIKDGELEPATNSFIWNDAIIYSVMPDRFLNGNPENDSPLENPDLTNQANFNGGDLQGLLLKIKEGYFDSLGINTLWIFPVNKTTNKSFKEYPEPHRYYSGYHGYWPIESRQIEPRFGTLEDFKLIVTEAHQRNLKILLDFISNHTHIDHIYYKNNPEWYGKVDLPNGEKNIRRWDEYRLTTWFDTFLPSFDYVHNDEAVNAVTDDAIWWIENTNIDGFRHDATKHVPHIFWRALTKKLKSKISSNRDLPVYQIGETFGSDDLIKSYVNNAMLTAQFNFNQFFIARRIFAENEGNFLDLSSSIEKSLEVYGYDNVMGNLMDSHDQVRMMALLDGDLTLSDNAVERAFQKPAIEVDEENTYKKELTYFAYLMTVPGIPVIYYGDEFGMTGAGDPDNRRMMRFGNDLIAIEKEQLKNVTKLIQIRKNNSAFRRGDYKTLLVSKDILVFTRGDILNRFLTIINKSESIQQITINLPAWMNTSQMKSLITNAKYEIIDNQLELEIDSYNYDILKLN